MYNNCCLYVKKIVVVFFISILIGMLSFQEIGAQTLNNNISEHDANQIDVNIDYSQLYNSKNFYESYIESLETLQKKYYMMEHLLEVKDIGKSVNGRAIKAIVVGNPSSKIKITINATHHQKEYINTILVLNQIDYMLQMYLDNETFENQNVKDILANVQIWFIPLVNPDGLELFNNYRFNGINPKGYTIEDITRGNSNGVNLNRNYDANFVQAESFGQYAFSEPETIALKNLHENETFDFAIAYHAAGNKIFWNYNQEGELYQKSLEIAKILGVRTGYPLSTDEKLIGADFGGYKDWLIIDKKIPAVTIETGTGNLETNNSKVIDWSQYISIWNENKDIPLSVSNYFYNSKYISKNYIEVNLFPISVKINGNQYTGESFIINGKTYVRSYEFTSAVNDKNITISQGIEKDSLFIDKSYLDKDYIYIGTKKYVLLKDIALQNQFEVIWDNENRGVIIEKKENLLKMINPLWVEATLVSDSIIFKDENMKEQIGIFKKGSAVIFLQDRSGKIANVKLGQISGWTKYSNIKVSQNNYLKNIEIPTYTKEFFVNEMGYSSNTNNLIWINLENTSVNVFEKSEEKWDLIKSIDCSIGSNNTPTINGVFEYNRYVPRENSNYYYVSDVMKFYKAFGMHSVLMKKDGTIYDGRLKIAISHGCIRMLPEDITWLKDNCRIGTTVVVW